MLQGDVQRASVPFPLCASNPGAVASEMPSHNHYKTPRECAGNLVAKTDASLPVCGFDLNELPGVTRRQKNRRPANNAGLRYDSYRKFSTIMRSDPASSICDQAM
jgi:hypothetical protein